MSHFASHDMAQGYAKARPAVHPLVIAAARHYTGERAVGLDVGCGSGLSTRALAGLAQRCIGVEPVESMARLAGAIAGAAEALPIASSSVDVISAAGALNYVALDRFFPEALRVLKRDGVLLVYDFSPGRSFRNNDSLDRWFDAFITRYPWPSGSALYLDPDVLASLDSGFTLQHGERFEYALRLTPEFHLEYMLTETCVAEAVRNGTPMSAIRQWCADTLSAVFTEPQDVLFRGYFVVMRPA